jgi:hypothetical protein
MPACHENIGSIAKHITPTAAIQQLVAVWKVLRKKTANL